MSAEISLGASYASTENLYNRDGTQSVFQEGEAADETYQERFRRFIHSSDTRYFGVRESGVENDGSMYIAVSYTHLTLPTTPYE